MLAGFRVGVGKADVTGPVAEITLMGYADPRQKGAGILTRLHSRAFVIETDRNQEDDSDDGDDDGDGYDGGDSDGHAGDDDDDNTAKDGGADRVIFVSVDAGMTSQLVRRHVLRKLRRRFGSGAVSEDNLVISSTHTHSGPGGYGEGGRKRAREREGEREREREREKEREEERERGGRGEG